MPFLRHRTCISFLLFLLLSAVSQASTVFSDIPYKQQRAFGLSYGSLPYDFYLGCAYVCLCKADTANVDERKTTPNCISTVGRLICSDRFCFTQVISSALLAS